MNWDTNNALNHSGHRFDSKKVFKLVKSVIGESWIYETFIVLDYFQPNKIESSIEGDHCDQYQAVVFLIGYCL